MSLTKQIIKRKDLRNGDVLLLIKSPTAGKYGLGYYRVVRDTGLNTFGQGIFYKDEIQKAKKRFDEIYNERGI